MARYVSLVTEVARVRFPFHSGAVQRLKVYSRGESLLASGITLVRRAVLERHRYPPSSVFCIGQMER